MYFTWDLTFPDPVPCLYKTGKSVVARLERQEPVGDSVFSPRALCLLPRCACTGPSSPVNGGTALAAAPWAWAQVLSHRDCGV